MHLAFTAQVLRKYQAKYECCNNCGFLRVCEPHWLEEAYSSAIASADTGLVMRNLSIASKLVAVLYGVLGERGEGRYLDSAGGYGMLTRLMRDCGFNFYWSDKYCENLLSRGFEYNPNIGSCRAVTAMEVMEHLTDPAAFVDEVLEASGAETLLFTTELYTGAPPRPEDWWYYALPTGQHIGFFQKQTLENLGQRLGLHLLSSHGLHALTRKPLDARRFAIATNPHFARLASLFIRRRVRSKTLDDHNLIIAKL